MTTWLVTGGAGYIGNHVTRALIASGRKVVVLDDLSSGNSDRIPAGATFIEANIIDRQKVVAALAEHDVDGVIHLAAKKAAGESVDVPLYYYRENVAGMLSLLEAMQEAGVKRLVYSSSAAVYGTPKVNPVRETAELAAESPYGETKVVGEWMAKSEGVANGLSWVALRYFNVAGAGNSAQGHLTSGRMDFVFAHALARLGGVGDAGRDGIDPHLRRKRTRHCFCRAR